MANGIETEKVARQVTSSFRTRLYIQHCHILWLHYERENVCGIVGCERTEKLGNLLCEEPLVTTAISENLCMQKEIARKMSQ